MTHLKRLLMSAAITCMALRLDAPAHAQDVGADGTFPPPETGWEFDAAVYLWGAGLGGEVSDGDALELSLGTILENLNAGGMATLAARNGKWTLFSDLIYLNLGDKKDGSVTIGRDTVDTYVDLQVKGFITTTGIGYSIFDNPDTELSVLGGVRFLKFKTDTKLELGGLDRRVKSDPSLTDGVIGLRGQSNLSGNWYADYCADVGTGDSDLTWQAAVGLGYRFEKLDIAFGHRYLRWDLDSSSDLSDLTIKGPYAGLKFVF
ncbi:hypothetical protein [Aliiruegeria sabulilitoris]|uniref:hypothetical protein n=1 Tax=Aliiruegeria sabulilitoris TaxID=1510458 RepID=UPI00082CB88A|nr:hypothetical protein [Aliiruegeria sabulilitoris]NDR58737.1 hypothetical protein [Pseudoruegeria sp. M32A2M]